MLKSTSKYLCSSYAALTLCKFILRQHQRDRSSFRRLHNRCLIGWNCKGINGVSAKKQQPKQVTYCTCTHRINSFQLMFSQRYIHIITQLYITTLCTKISNLTARNATGKANKPIQIHTAYHLYHVCNNNLDIVTYSLGKVAVFFYLFNSSYPL